MASLASFIGGAGEAAAEHGRQVRALLEQRRGHYVDVLSNLMKEETDPQRLAEYHSTIADLLSGKPMEKVAPAGFKMLQDHHQANVAMSQAIGGPPSQPKPQPGPAQPGQVPGTLQPGSAAQPATSPVQPSQQIQPIQSPEQNMEHPNPIADQIAPPQQAAAPPQAAPQSAVGAPTEFLGHPLEYWMSTPAGRAQAERFLQPYSQNTAELQRLQGIHEFDMAHKRQGLAALKASPIWAQLPPHVQGAYEAEASGLPAVQLPQTYFTPRVLSTATDGADAPPGTMEFGTNIPVRPGKTYRRELRGDGTEIWSPTLGPAPTVSDTATGGRELTNRYTGKAIGPVEGAVAPSQIAPHIVTGENGRIQALSAPQINSGDFINPQFAPVTTSSTHEVPGQLPEHTSTTRTRGTSVTPAAAGPRGGGAIPPVVPPSGQGGPVAAMYKDWVDGNSVPTGKNKVAVEEYARQTGQPIPSAMSATGQKDVSHIDEVLGQIADIKQKMKELKLDNSSNRIDSYVDYLRAQRLGDKTKYGGLWTDLSFEGLRSGGAALQGMSARGQQIIQKALEHVPRPTAELNPRSHEIIHAPDTPARMYQKLEEMENILKHSKENVLRDEKKSGVITPVGGSGGPNTVNVERDANGKLVIK